MERERNRPMIERKLLVRKTSPKDEGTKEENQPMRDSYKEDVNLETTLIKDQDATTQNGELSVNKVEVGVKRGKVVVCHCYQAYKRALTKVLSGINFFFGLLGTNIARYPIPWIIGCLLLVSICCVGFFRWKTENRTEELYVPKGTETDRILDRTRKYFKTFYEFRTEEIILRPKLGDNYIQSDCIQEAKLLYKDIINIMDFKNLCVPKPSYIHQFQQYDTSHNCSVLNPLELISSNGSALQDISAAFASRSVLMSNGKIPLYNQAETIALFQKGKLGFEKIGAIRIVFHMLQSDVRPSVMDWEEQYIKLLEKWQTKLVCSSVVFSAQRSVDDSITESSGADVKLVTVSFVLMILFACSAMAKIRNPIRGHALLASFGIFSTALGIAGGIGLALLFGVPYVSIVGILTFLTLSIGVDDMFIILDEYDRHMDEEDPVERISKTLRHVGGTITMTTLTDIVAFGIGTISDHPGIRYFCMYAAITFAVEFFLQVTLFIAFLSYDARRIRASRRDCLPCCKGKDMDTCVTQVNENFASLFMRKYSTVLVKWPAKLLVFLISGVLLSGGIYGSLNVSQEFSRTTLVPDGSYYLHYVNVLENEFKLAVGVNLVKLGTLDYSNVELQNEFDKAADAAFATGYYQRTTVSWIRAYRTWARATHINIHGRNFTRMLPVFLSQPPFVHFKDDVKINAQKEIEASRTHIFTKPIWKSTFLRDAMVNTRKEFKRRDITVLPISDLFIFFEQFAAVVGEVSRNVSLTAAAVLIMALPFCISPSIVLLLLFSFILLILELIGLMYLWDISLNAISMIDLVMSVGFAVDYSAHVAYSFMTSKEKTPNDRIIDSLSHVGASVLMGGLSTFTGMLITFLGTSELFRIFFRMLFGIVVISLYHGLVLLPVLFSVFGALI